MEFAKKRPILLWSVLLLILAVGSCSGIRLISDYDDVTDKSLTAIQQAVGDFIDLLIKQAGTDSAAFDKHKDFYDGIDTQLRRLEFRVALIPKNTKTIKLVKDIRSVILGSANSSSEGNSLRDLHCSVSNKDRGPSSTALEINRRNINQAISAALSLELAKKQGNEKNK